MKKNHERNPVFRLASVIPTLVGERGVCGATVLQAAAQEQYSLRGL